MTINREDWLTRAAMIASDMLFKRAGYTVPNNVRYSMSLPSRNAMSAKRTTIGQCWSSVASSDGNIEIFITPLIDDARSVYATLVHEMVHAVVGNEHGHDKIFKRCALAVGLEGKMTATTITDAAWDEAKPILEKRLGAYPHGKMGNLSSKKKQTARMVKIECACGYGPIRASRKIINHEAGLPLCPSCGDCMMAMY